MMEVKRIPRFTTNKTFIYSYLPVFSTITQLNLFSIRSPIKRAIFMLKLNRAYFLKKKKCILEGTLLSLKYFYLHHGLESQGLEVWVWATEEFAERKAAHLASCYNNQSHVPNFQIKGHHQ